MQKLITLSIILFSYFNMFSSSFSVQKQTDSITQKANYYFEQLKHHAIKSEYETVKTYSDSLYTIASKNGLTKFEVLALVNHGIYYKNRFEMEKALDFYNKALEKCKLIPEELRTKVVVLVNIGNIYNNLEFPEKAIECMKKVLAVTDTIKGFERPKAAAHIGISNNYAEIKDYKNTIKHAFKSIDIAKQIKDENIIVSSIGNISDAYFQQEKYEQALDIAKKALTLSIVQKKNTQRGIIYLNIGKAEFKLKNIDQAKSYLKEAQNIAIEQNILELQMDTHEVLTLVYEADGNLKASLEEQKKYSEIRNLYLKEIKNASNSDLKKDLNQKDTEITKNNAILSETRNYVFFIGLICLVLIGMLIFYLKRKKEIEKEQLELRKEYQNLKNTIEKAKKEELVLLKPKSYKNSSLTAQDYKNYKTIILKHMESEKPYLDAELKQSDLAKKLDLTTNHLSEILNHCFNQNFYNFINSYRIIEAQKLIKNSECADFKIIAIAFDSGFNSKSSFNRAFKSLTGQTPSEFKNTNYSVSA